MDIGVEETLSPPMGSMPFGSANILTMTRIRFESVDVGTIRSSQTLEPRILARVSRPSPLDADIRPAWGQGEVYGRASIIHNL